LIGPRHHAQAKQFLQFRRMFSSGIIPPAIVREHRRSDTELAGNEAYDFGRHCIVLREWGPM
jgi:hypothetical protein